MTRQELLETILLLKDWQENIVEQLTLVTENDGKIVVQSGREGDKPITLDGDIAKGVKYGVIVALDLIKKFPVTITKD